MQQAFRWTGYNFYIFQWLQGFGIAVSKWPGGLCPWVPSKKLLYCFWWNQHTHTLSPMTFCNWNRTVQFSCALVEICVTGSKSLWELVVRTCSLLEAIYVMVGQLDLNIIVVGMWCFFWPGWCFLRAFSWMSQLKSALGLEMRALVLNLPGLEPMAITPGILLRLWWRRESQLTEYLICLFESHYYIKFINHSLTNKINNKVWI